MAILKSAAPSRRQDAQPMVIAVLEPAFPVSVPKPVQRTTNVAAGNLASRAVVASGARRITNAQPVNYVALVAAPQDARPIPIAPSSKLALTDSVEILVR